METSLFDYHLPPERIAQEPTAVRDQSRLLVVHRGERRIEHRKFTDIVEYLGENDFLFRNNAKVLPARIFGQRPTGGQVECLLLRASSGDALSWWCLLKPGKKLPAGSTFSIPGSFEAEVIEKNAAAEYLVRFAIASHSSVPALAEAHGKMPLPPYIAREKEDARDAADKDRYQTVYADSEKAVAAAAPTAGLHFTPEVISRLKANGTRFHDLVLHVGMGTFKPLEAATVQEHRIHREIYEVPAAARRALAEAPEQGRRRVAVGTTSVRTIEDYLAKSPASGDAPFKDEAGIFIYPPYRFAGIDALVTNFHLPRSTLLCLASAFLVPGSSDGIAWLHEIYAEAIKREYRFLSYGDSMLIL